MLTLISITLGISLAARGLISTSTSWDSGIDIVDEAGEEDAGDAIVN
jgi:hypothetical protein